MIASKNKNTPHASVKCECKVNKIIIVCVCHCGAAAKRYSINGFLDVMPGSL